MPMPDHTLSKEERDKIAAINLVSDDWKHLNPQTWTPQHVAFIKTAAQQPEVERVLVNAAIKKELCRVEDKAHASWMAKVRPWYGHHDHIHVRLRCPAEFAKLPRATASFRRRRLQCQGAQLLVLRQGAAPADHAGKTGKTAEAGHARRPSAGLQNGA